MFEKIVLRNSETSQNISVGQFAEALLFYQNVHLILDYASLISLVQSIGLEKFLSLIRRPNISAVYCDTSLGTQTINVGVNQQHSFIGFKITGDQNYGTVKTKQERFEYIFNVIFGFPRREARKLSEAFLKLVPVTSLDSDYYISGGLFKSAKLDLLDNNFILSALQKSIVFEEGVPPDYKFNKFEIINNPKEFYIFSDINFESINQRRKLIDPNAGELTHAFLINRILEAKADALFASHYGGDFQTSNVVSQIIQMRYSEILKRSGISTIEKNEFQNIVVADCPSIRDVMNSKDRSFDDFLKLLDKSEKFKEWIQKANPDDKLVSNYIKDVTSQGWGDKLPTRIIRYLFTNVVSFVEPITGQGLSLADSFLVDKIIKGWRPNHFVEKNLKPFLKNDA